MSINGTHYEFAIARRHFFKWPPFVFLLSFSLCLFIYLKLVDFSKYLNRNSLSEKKQTPEKEKKHGEVRTTLCFPPHLFCIIIWKHWSFIDLWSVNKCRMYPYKEIAKITIVIKHKTNRYYTLIQVPGPGSEEKHNKSTTDYLVNECKMFLL